MKIIAIDSSGLTASVAILEDNKMIADYSVNYKKTHSQTLVPMLDEITRMTETDLATVDAIAISKGPGSFTGLRIGSSTAKGLGLALNIPIIEVATTDALAYNFYGSDRIICPIMDARREQVYTGLYRFTKNGDGLEMETLLESCAIPVEEIVMKVNELGKAVIFLGDAVSVYGDKLKELVKVDYILAAPHMSHQRAASVAAIGARKLANNEVVPASEHVPEYLRLSQAERERNEAMNGN